MGMQDFIRRRAESQEEKRKAEIKKAGKDTCPECGRNRSQWFRNMMDTLECLCGKKFYGE